MKKLAVLFALMSISISSFAKINCQNLGITITNQSGHDCKLRINNRYYGSLYQGEIPTHIPNGTTTEVFYMKQSGNGVGIQLDYRCDNKVAIFTSYQDYCYMSAGSVWGTYYIGNDFSTISQPQMGSYWSGMPGQISWKIY